VLVLLDRGHVFRLRQDLCRAGRRRQRENAREDDGVCGLARGVPKKAPGCAAAAQFPSCRAGIWPF
jgi:hypothetical protein